MEYRELLKELLEEQLEDVSIDQVVKEISKEAINKELISAIKSEIRMQIDGIAPEMIKKEVEKSMRGEITISDGWNTKKDTFEGFVKQEIHSKLTDTWKVKDIIKETIQDHAERITEVHKDNFLELLKEFLNKKTIV
tara:strand:- start:813 stop:1223 length:411 start_codon:yes stop_codon:yes gene_type:complete